MPRDVPADEWITLIADNETGWYTVDVEDVDVQLALDDKPSQARAGIVGRAGDSLPIDVTDVDGVFARAIDSPATLRLATGLVQRQSRREVERPQDAASREGKTQNAEASVAPNSGNSATETLVDNTDGDNTVYIELVTASLAGSFYEDGAEWTVDAEVQRFDPDTITTVDLAKFNPAQAPVPFDPAVPINPGQTLQLSVQNEASTSQQLNVNVALREE